MPRPNISGRALRAHAAAFAAAALFLAAPAGATTLLQATGGTFGALARTRLSFRHVRADVNVLTGTPASVSGALLPAKAGHLVDLQRFTGHGWRTLAHAYTGARGRFDIRYTPHRLLSERLRIVFPGDPFARAIAHGVGRLATYRLVGASWYGGGGSLACGGTLTSATMGVANKTLPCGTMVTLRYGGRSVRVPVVDRGPYVAGREYDLTEATKAALGFEGVGTVWSSR